MKTVDKLYCHVSNSGITFEVVDHREEGLGAGIRVHSSAFGNLRTTLEVYTDARTLKALGEMFLRASEHEFGREYSAAARAPSEDAERSEVFGVKSEGS